MRVACGPPSRPLGVGLSDLAYFDNMLHDQAPLRAKKHEFMLRVFDAAALLGVDAVCGFVGRNQRHSMDENLIDFEEQFVPLLKAAKDRGLTFRVEQCPMPGWTTGDNWHNNIAYTPGAWIALHRICDRHGVGDQFRIHYDPSHAILMGQDTRSVFQYLKDTGYNFLIGGFHVKGQVIDAKGLAAWGYGGQTLERGDWIDGRPSPAPADQVNAWKKQVAFSEHELPGTARHDPLAYLQNRTVDWLDHQLAARELLQLDVANTHLIVEHEYPKARIQERDRLAPILQGSIAFVRHIDEAAALHVRAAARGAAATDHPHSGNRPRGGTARKRRARKPAPSPLRAAIDYTTPGTQGNIVDHHNNLAILVGGGPAPGINSVDRRGDHPRAARRHRGARPRDGFEWIMRGDIDHVMPPHRRRQPIHFRGGSAPSASRAQPDDGPEPLENTVISLLRLKRLAAHHHRRRRAPVSRR